jgi:hypothetical protein
MSDEKKAEEVMDPILEGLLRQERSEEAWAEYVMDERPAALAEYLALGGEVDEAVRRALILALKDHPKGRKGGNRPFRDWQTFLSVAEILSQDRLHSTSAEKENSELDRAPKRKPMSLRQAQEKHAIETNQELRTVERQYVRGQKIDSQFQ